MMFIPSVRVICVGCLRLAAMGNPIVFNQPWISCWPVGTLNEPHRKIPQVPEGNGTASCVNSRKKERKKETKQRQIDRKIERIEKYRNKKQTKNKQIDTETKKQRNKQTNKHTYIHYITYIHTNKQKKEGNKRRRKKRKKKRKKNKQSRQRQARPLLSLEKRALNLRQSSFKIAWKPSARDRRELNILSSAKLKVRIRAFAKSF